MKKRMIVEVGGSESPVIFPVKHELRPERVKCFWPE